MEREGDRERKSEKVRVTELADCSKKKNWHAAKQLLKTQRTCCSYSNVANLINNSNAGTVQHSCAWGMKLNWFSSIGHLFQMVPKRQDGREAQREVRPKAFLHTVFPPKIAPTRTGLLMQSMMGVGFLSRPKHLENRMPFCVVGLNKGLLISGSVCCHHLSNTIQLYCPFPLRNNLPVVSPNLLSVGEENCFKVTAKASALFGIWIRCEYYTYKKTLPASLIGDIGFSYNGGLSLRVDLIICQ